MSFQNKIFGKQLYFLRLSYFKFFSLLNNNIHFKFIIPEQNIIRNDSIFKNQISDKQFL